MLSVMEPCAVDLLPRPIRDGASGASAGGGDSDGACRPAAAAGGRPDGPTPPPSGPESAELEDAALRPSEAERLQPDGQLTEDEDRLLAEDSDGGLRPHTVGPAAAAADGEASNSSETDPARPIDLPDDMFESAAALNAAEEEQDRERREANQRARAALDAGDSTDGCEATDPSEAADSRDAYEGGESRDAFDGADPLDAAGAVSAGDAAVQTDPDDPLDPDDAVDSPSDAPPSDPDDPDTPDESLSDSGGGRSGRPAAAAARKRSLSPTPAETSKLRRMDAAGGGGGRAKPFIEVKKVKLSEDNIRLLQESNERDRRRLEGAAVSPVPVNGVRPPLLQRVRQLSRQELETLVLEKMCESIASRSVIGDMKKSAEKHMAAAERFQKKITHLQKQVGDLHLVVRKLSAELKSRRSASYPVKITRTVGLQVMLAKSVPPLTVRPRPAAAGPPPPNPASNGMLRAQLSSPVRPRPPARVPPTGQPALRPVTTMPGTPPRPGRPPAQASQPVRPPVMVVPVASTGMLSLGSVPQLATSPQRPALLASPSAALKSAQARSYVTPAVGRTRGRTLRQPAAPAAAASPAAAAAAASSSADVVDLTDDDDSRRPAGRGGTPTSSGRTDAAAVTATAVARVASVVAGSARGASLGHPAPFPVTPPNPAVHTGQLLPPPPVLKVDRRANGIVLTWTMDLTQRHATVVSYHLFAYQEAGPVVARPNPWKKVGDVKALPLPMVCTLTQFQEGHKYHFAVRAEDSFRRRGPFSNPSSIALLAPS